MKNKKIIVIIVLIGIIIGLAIANLNNKNFNIQKRESSKEQLETTTDNAYVSMETHLSEVNAKQQAQDNRVYLMKNGIQQEGYEDSFIFNNTYSYNNEGYLEINNTTWFGYYIDVTDINWICVRVTNNNLNYNPLQVYVGNTNLESNPTCNIAGTCTIDVSDYTGYYYIGWRYQVGGAITKLYDVWYE